jgi:hypothetical protein
MLIVLSPWIYPRLSGAHLTESETPVGAMDYMAAEHLQGNAFHPQIYGDYLIWRLWPEQRSFIDGRVHLFSEAFVAEYQRILCALDWQQVLQKYDVRHLLLHKDPSDICAQRMISSARNSQRWQVRYEDGISVLLSRREPAAESGAFPEQDTPTEELR